MRDVALRQEGGALPAGALARGIDHLQQIVERPGVVTLVVAIGVDLRGIDLLLDADRAEAFADHDRFEQSVAGAGQHGFAPALVSLAVEIGVAIVGIAAATTMMMPV